MTMLLRSSLLPFETLLFFRDDFLTCSIYTPSVFILCGDSPRFFKWYFLIVFDVDGTGVDYFQIQISARAGPVHSKLVKGSKGTIKSANFPQNLTLTLSLCAPKKLQDLLM